MRAAFTHHAREVRGLICTATNDEKSAPVALIEGLSQLHSFMMRRRKPLNTLGRSSANTSRVSTFTKIPSHLISAEVLFHPSPQDIVELALPCVIFIVHSLDGFGSIAVECAYHIFVKHPPAHIPPHYLSGSCSFAISFVGPSSQGTS